MKIVWYCKLCNWVSVSDSRMKHCMDYCECGKTAMDLEEGYSRMIGHPIKLAVFDKGKWTRKRKVKVPVKDISKALTILRKGRRKKINRRLT